MSVKRKPADMASSQIVQRDGTNESYITFLETDGSFQGEIAQRAKGAVFRSRNGDFAEWRRRHEQVPPFEEGDVVGIDDSGLLTRRTLGLTQVGVISRVAMVEGSVPEPSEIESFDMVAYAGHVPVKLRGPCKPGGLVVPSGLEDGTAVAHNSRFAPAVRLGRAMNLVQEGSAVSNQSFELGTLASQHPLSSLSSSAVPAKQQRLLPDYKLRTISVFNPVDTVPTNCLRTLCGDCAQCFFKHLPLVRRGLVLLASIMMGVTIVWFWFKTVSGDDEAILGHLDPTENEEAGPVKHPEAFGRFEVISGPCTLSKQRTCVGRADGYGTKTRADCQQWSAANRFVGVSRCGAKSLPLCV